MFETLQLEFTGKLAIITLNRPDKRNAISPQMICRNAIRTRRNRDQPRARGNHYRRWQSFLRRHGPGNALRHRAPVPAENMDDSRQMAHMFRRIWSFSKPLIAAVNGAALAGGCGIATLCDFTLAVPEAKFGYTEVKIGFLPAIVSVFLTRQIGDKRARDLLLTGRLISAEEAKELGLVNGNRAARSFAVSRPRIG